MTAVEPMRIAQFSDLHYGPRHLEEADRCFGAAIDSAIAAKVDVAVISGDATDHALDLHSPSALRLLRQVKRLADHCPVLMLQGTWSHEPPGTLSVFSMLHGRHPVAVVDRIQQVALLPSSISGGDLAWAASEGHGFDALPAGARALFTCVPSINKAAVASAVGAPAAGEALGEQLGRLLLGYAPIHRLARTLGLPTIGISHGTVFGCETEHGVPMAGFDHEFTSGALFAAEAQAFMLGHIHRHQRWTRDGGQGRQCIAYPGSIGRFHHGEQDDKGFLLWEVGPDGARCHLVPTPARRTLDIFFEGRPDLQQLQAAVSAQDLAGASVRVRWCVADEDRHQVDRGAIQRLLADAADVKLEGRVVPVTRSRSPGIAQLASLADKVRAWAAATDVRSEPLMDCLAQLATSAPEDIVRAVMDDRAEASSAGNAAPDRSEPADSVSVCADALDARG